MRIYAVIDTNVLVSAMLKRASFPGNVLEFAFNGVITPLLNDAIISEYREVLLRDKFHLSEEIVNDVIEALTDMGEFINPDSIDITLSDSEDVIFYEIVMEKRKKTDNAYLVTGNTKHFPVQRFVVTPREMIDIILEKS